MRIYYIVFIWLAIMAILSKFTKFTEVTVVNGKKVRRWGFVYAALAFAPVFYIAVFTAARADTVGYLNAYKRLSLSFSGLIETVKTKDGGAGFIVFEWIIKSVFGERTLPFRAILGLLHSIPVIYVMRKYSKNYALALFLFLATGCHIAWMMNGLRQYLAVSIIMAATPLMLEKKYIPLIFVILLASTIHTSALIMLPIVFAVQGEPWKWKSTLVIIATVIVAYVLSRNLSLLDSVLENTEYSGAMAYAAQTGDDGTNPIRVLVNSMPMIIAFIGRRQIKTKNDRTMNLFVNMSIVTACINLVSMVTSGVMIGRLPIYTSIYSLIFMADCLPIIFTRESSELVTICMIILYFGFYLYGYRGF